MVHCDFYAIFRLTLQGRFKIKSEVANKPVQRQGPDRNLELCHREYLPESSPQTSPISSATVAIRKREEHDRGRFI